MRIVIVLFFIISLSACSSSTDIAERPENPSDIKSGETTRDQGETDINKVNPNMIRKQTESTFRTIRSQNEVNLEPLAPSRPDDSDADKQ